MTRGRPIQKGESGNPGGRPRGSRNALSEDFLTTLAADFAEHGTQVIEAVRLTSPETYLRVVATISAKATHAQVDTVQPVIIKWASPAAADL